MRIAISRPRSRRWAALLVCGLPVLGACDDRPEPTTPVAPPEVPGAVAALQCTATVAEPAMECVDVPQTLVQTSGAPGGGPSLDSRIVGSQGYYVRLRSFDHWYSGTEFYMQVDVQNLSTLPMATSDGTTPHAEGVRVFFAQDPIGEGGEVSFANPTGTAFFTSAEQPYFQYGGTINGSQRPDLGPDGILSPGETTAHQYWRFAVPAGVTSFRFFVWISTQMPPGHIRTAAPQITSISPATLRPGDTATVTGENFSVTASSNEVTFSGRKGKVVSGSATQLRVVVPCVASGAVPVRVRQSFMTGLPVAATVRPGQLVPLQTGQSVIFSPPQPEYCLELPPTGGESKYVVAVYNASTDVGTRHRYVISGDTWSTRASLAAEPAPAAPAPAVLPAAQPRADPHTALLERNRREGERLQARFRDDARMHASRAVTAALVQPPLTHTFYLSKRTADDFCGVFSSVTASRVYWSGRIAIYESAGVPAGVRSTDNPQVAAYYQKIGDQLNADIEPLVRTHFGDPLLRDLDGNGVVMVLAMPTGADFLLTPGFAVSCDQFPNDGAANAASNFGEVIYTYTPYYTGTTGPATVSQWYTTVRTSLAHQMKHLASYAWRAANGAAAWEETWLEEATARHAEELWARRVYGVVWKGNTGYGSAAAPGSIYCDGSEAAECTASNPLLPSWNMQRIFLDFVDIFAALGHISIFGTTPDESFTRYGRSPLSPTTAWSFTRYAIDRYATTEASFLTELTQSTLTGVDNLTARTGAPLAEMMGGWALAMYADDRPGTAANPVLQMPTWNLRDISEAFMAQGRFIPPRTELVDAWSRRFDSLDWSGLLYGGTWQLHVLTGTLPRPEVIHLTTDDPNAVLNSNIRIAIARLQ